MKIEAEVRIKCRPEEVFKWIDEPSKAMLWQKGIKSTEVITLMPGKTGTTFREIMEEDGKRLEMSGTITGFTPGRMISFQLESRIHKICAIYTVTGNKDVSEVKVESSIHWKFPMNMITLVFGTKIKSKILEQTHIELSELKQLCEVQGI